MPLSCPTVTVIVVKVVVCGCPTVCRRVCRADADVEVEQEFYKRTVPATNEAQTGEVRLSCYASVYTTAACNWCYCVWGGGVC